MSATRKQPSRGNKGGSSSRVRTSPGERSEEGGRASSQRKGHGREGAANSPQASIIQREGGQTQTQGQRARRRPSRSQQSASNNTSKSKSAAPSSASTLPPPASSVTTATSTSGTINPLPSPTTASTTTVKRTFDVAPPTVGPKGIMHDKMVHVSFQPIPETPTSVPPSNRATRAQKREERQQQRNSQSMDNEDSDSDCDSPRVKGLFDHPLLPPKKSRKKHKPTTASTKNISDTAPGSVPNAMDLDLKSAVAQQAPPTPFSAQPLPSPSQGVGSSYWTQPWVCAAHLLAHDFAPSSLS